MFSAWTNEGTHLPAQACQRDFRQVGTWRVHTSEVIRAIWCSGGRIASQSEVIRAGTVPRCVVHRRRWPVTADAAGLSADEGHSPCACASCNPPANEMQSSLDTTVHASNNKNKHKNKQEQARTAREARRSMSMQMTMTNTKTKTNNSNNNDNNTNNQTNNTTKHNNTNGNDMKRISKTKTNSSSPRRPGPPHIVGLPPRLGPHDRRAVLPVAADRELHRSTIRSPVIPR